MKVSFFTLGCKLNQAETDELKKDLANLGLIITSFTEPADVCVVRACGVTCGASQTTREIIRKAKKTGAKVVVCGCLENTELPEIDFIASTNQAAKEYVASLVKNYEKKKIKKVLTHTRGLVKIQNGCNFNCTYCIIPSFRGKNQSLLASDITKKIKTMVNDGYKEITLTGINICWYQDKKIDLAKLIKKILKETKIKRIRLGSMDPRLISSDLIKIYSTPNPRLMPHWHLSLQSGANSVLKRMNRHYTAEQYLTIIKKLRKNNPLFSFTTDIIIGFPGETEQEFLETINFVQTVGFAKIHVFPFSPRPKTKAIEMKKQFISEKLKKERVKILIQIAKKTAKKFSEKFYGLKRPILAEQKKSNTRFGYTPEYLRVKINDENINDNQIKNIKLGKDNLDEGVDKENN